MSTKTRIETIAVISDTHGLMRPELRTHLQGISRILHAGDVGRPEVLDELRLFAPVTAVRGNVDHGGWAEELPWHESVEVGEHLVYLTHIRAEIDLDPEAADVKLVIFGHTHAPVIEQKGTVTWFNPGSVGPRRFSLPVSMGYLHLHADGSLEPELIELEV